MLVSVWDGIARDANVCVRNLRYVLWDPGSIDACPSGAVVGQNGAPRPPRDGYSCEKQ